MQYAPLDKRDHPRSKIGIVGREANPVLDATRADRRLRVRSDEQQARNSESGESLPVGVLFRPANKHDVASEAPFTEGKIGFANRHAQLILHPVAMYYDNL